MLSSTGMSMLPGMNLQKIMSIRNATEANDVILIKTLSSQTVSCVDGFSDVVGWLEALLRNEHVGMASWAVTPANLLSASET